MELNQIKTEILTSPAFVLDERKIIEKLQLLSQLREQCGCKVLYSIKSLPFSSVLHWAKPYVDGFSVSSLYEARLADEVLKGSGSIHLTSPGLRVDEIDELSKLCNYISFNSLSQYENLSTLTKHDYSTGLRLNPKLSYIQDERYDPCRKHSKLGMEISQIEQQDFLADIKGLHFHTVYSYQNYIPLIAIIEKIQTCLKSKLANLQWINLGGGYLFNPATDHSAFINLVKSLQLQYDIEVFIEPGNAIVNEAGYLLATVIDLFNSDGKIIAVLDTSVNHHPEVFEYQKKPELEEEHEAGINSTILAGSSCLAGDLFGEYQLNNQLLIGDRVLFKNVGAYSLIKANRFNGHNLPAIYSFNR